MRGLVFGLLCVASACEGHDDVAAPMPGSGGSGGGSSGSAGMSDSGSGAWGNGGGSVCEPAAPVNAAHAVVSRDVLVTASHSQRSLAIAFDVTSSAYALANVILLGENFPLEFRKASVASNSVVFSDPVMVLDAAAPAVTNTFDPSIAAADQGSRVLLVWADDRLGNGNGMLEIFGQFFDLSASPPQKLGENFSISTQPTTNEWRPHLAFDPAGQKFWVAWADDRKFAQVSGGRYQHARSVGIDGELGPDFALGDETTWQDGVRIAVGSTGPLFVWSEYSEAGVFGRYRARLHEGAPLIDLYQSDTLSSAPPAVAWDAKRCRFVAVWQETASASAIDKQVWGVVLAADGSVIKPRFRITDHPAGAGAPNLDYSFATQTFVLTFGAWEESEAYFVELDGEGVPLGAPASLHQSAPAKGTYHHDIAAGVESAVAITNEDYARMEATLFARP